MSDLGLESADSFLKLVPASYEERCKPLVDGVRKVRAGAAHVRKEGVKANGTEKVNNTADSGLILTFSYPRWRAWRPPPCL